MFQNDLVSAVPRAFENALHATGASFSQVLSLPFEGRSAEESDSLSLSQCEQLAELEDRCGEADGRIEPGESWTDVAFCLAHLTPHWPDVRKFGRVVRNVCAALIAEGREDLSPTDAELRVEVLTIVKAESPSESHSDADLCDLVEHGEIDLSPLLGVSGLYREIQDRFPGESVTVDVCQRVVRDLIRRGKLRRIQTVNGVFYLPPFDDAQKAANDIVQSREATEAEGAAQSVDDALPNAATKHAQAAHLRAAASYEWVCTERPDLMPTGSRQKYARKQWEYLRENGCPPYCDETIGKPIRVPAFETWKRQVRAGRADPKKPKASSRMGRGHGKTIVHRSQI